MKISSIIALLLVGRCSSLIILKTSVTNTFCLQFQNRGQCQSKWRANYFDKKNLSYRFKQSALYSYSNSQTAFISTNAREEKSIEDLNRVVSRSYWVSWWIQIILSVISAVILTFANTVRRDSGFQSPSIWSSGFAFSSFGVLIGDSINPSADCTLHLNTCFIYFFSFCECSVDLEYHRSQQAYCFETDSTIRYYCNFT